MTVSNVPSFTDGPSMGASVGGLLLSVTVIVKLVSAIAPAASVARIVTGCVPGPSSSSGVQLYTPVVATSTEPAGAVTML